MRTFTGYLIIFIFAPLFVSLVILLSSEASKVQSFHHVLDSRIKLDDSKLSQTSYVKDQNGSIISEIHKPMNRIYLSADKIPAFLKELFVTSEDQHFYEHLGFDVTAMGRALAVNLKASEIEQGASTITQQLARNLYLNHEKSYNRKLSELLYAYELERKYSKDEILELYINTIYFQNGAYGIEAASKLYFQKNTTDLTKAQLAFLASIPNNPSLYDPVNHFNRTKERQERLIDQLLVKGQVNHEEAERLKNEKINITLKKRIDLYPDYLTYVEYEFRQLVSQNEGFALKIAQLDEPTRSQLEKELDERVQEMIGSGIIIHTALNPTVQSTAKKAIETYLPYQDIQGSAAVIDHKQHQIIALIGGKHYKKYDFNRAFQGYRQPGSSIKPLLVYAPYIERTNASLSERISANSVCIGGYCPKNYGGGNYGNVSLEKAFINSYNTPAVRLLNSIGIEQGFTDLSHFRFSKVSNRDWVLPSAVGGFTYGMTPLELSSAYTVFANNGVYKTPRSITKVTNLNGDILYSWNEQPVTIWSKETVDKMRILLNKTVRSGTARNAYYNTSYIGGKTGTTNDYHDYWFIGLNGDVTAGVWVGKDKPSNIKSIESATPQLHIWRSIVSSMD
ncbi:transglycosylase domain-containing protein [Cytobacillus sp. FJAT-54145]|uniref:Transglycosylase domain-containing protein n=1 Tax=Cytobacillus spartinae TaxID=3299023 RepID=A0ABW6KDY1_9BACI